MNDRTMSVYRNMRTNETVGINKIKYDRGSASMDSGRVSVGRRALLQYIFLWYVAYLNHCGMY
jgi:hypothetical protein